jgi:hypothetical protein
MIKPPALALQSLELDHMVTDKRIETDNQQLIPSGPRHLLQRLAGITSRQPSREQSDNTCSYGYQLDSSDDPLLLQPAYANMVTMEPLLLHKHSKPTNGASGSS